MTTGQSLMFPGGAPGAEKEKRSIRIALEPVRMMIEQSGTPTGVVDHQVQEQPRAARMCRIGELPELILLGAQQFFNSRTEPLADGHTSATSKKQMLIISLSV
jgi:hypothetical protein